MSELKEILGGKAEAFGGEWDEDGYTIIKVLTGTKLLGVAECEYVTKAINEHEALEALANCKEGA